MTLWIVELPWTSPPISLNDRDHWRVAWRKRQAAKEAARWSIRAAKRRPRWEAAEVELVWRVRTLHTRDLDNPIATLKPCLDALVAERVIPGDDWRIVRRASVRIEPPDPSRKAAMWLEVTQTEPVDLAELAQTPRGR